MISTGKNNIKRRILTPHILRCWLISQDSLHTRGSAMFGLCRKFGETVVSCEADEVSWEKVVESNAWMSEGHAGKTSGLEIHALPSIWTKLAGKSADHDASGTSQTPEQMYRFDILDLVLEGTSLNATDVRSIQDDR